MMRRLRSRPRGFTLIELLVTVSVLALLAGLAVPSFNEAVLGSRLASVANAFIGSVQLARSEAIKRNAPVTLCRSADGTACAGAGGWQQGWIVFADSDADGTLDAGETRIHYQQALGRGLSFSGNNYTLDFEPSGVSVGGASLTLCRQSPRPGAQERTVTVSTIGRVSVETTRTGSCA